MSKIIWFDTETTGLNPQYDEIIQIAILMEIDGAIVDRFELKLKPTVPICEPAFKAHGMNAASLMNCPNQALGYVALKTFFKKYINPFDRGDKAWIAGHNVASFDKEFLLQLFLRNQDKYLGSFINWRIIDTLQMAYILTAVGKLPELSAYNLSALCTHFNIKLDAHDALEDINATREVYLKLKEIIL